MSLALSATLALIPHPDDPNPAGEESVKIRREQAKGLAQAAYSAIESESELDESNENPQEALSVEKAAIPRQPFHPCCPVRNENIIALLLLSTFGTFSFCLMPVGSREICLLAMYLACFCKY